MTALGDDCGDDQSALIPFAEALRAIAERVICVAATETIDLRQALGRILARDIAAVRSVPPADNSAVDGYAVAFADLDAHGTTRLPVGGEVAAGGWLGRPVAPGEAIHIFTGAALPDGCDSVAMQEDCREEGAAVLIPPGLRRGANRRLAGEDVSRGQTILARGQRLQAQHIGLIAAAAERRIDVYRPLRVAVLSTGDELREPSEAEPKEALPPGTLCDANRYALIALLEGLGCAVDDLGIIGDRLPAIREALGQAAAGCQLIISSGGMSAGREDHVKAAVRTLGSLHLWHLAIKPGRPIGIGEVGGVPFAGLPGNPVAMMVTFLLLARPLILRLAGATPRPPTRYPLAADFSHRKKRGRREWLRASLIETGAGVLAVRKFPRDGSGILSSLVDSDGLVELPEALTEVEPGMAVDFIPFSEFR